jgi:ubiquinone/menaquinone biosynthesis C-methylase UbiE
MNEGKFTGKAKIYSKYRPTYPKALIDYLYSEIGLSESSTIADIGSGTGIFSRLLLQNNSRVIGVEPNDDMRQTAEKELTRFAKYTSIKASAENTTLSDSSIDYITVAQAFHWFDRANFRLECKRILKSNSKVILVWNTRDSSSDLVIENDKINKQYCPGYNGFSGGTGGDDPENYADFFKGGKCEYQTFENNISFEKDGFIGRNLSASYAPKEGTEAYHAYIDGLERLFCKYSINGRLCLPNSAKSYIGKV